MPILAEMLTAVFAVTAAVVIVNVADVAPAATVTVAGTVALVLFEARVTTLPLGPAGPVNVTVPITGAPPNRADGESVTLDTPAPVTVRTVVFVTEPAVAVTVTGVSDETGLVLILNVAEVAPAGTVTLAGTVALVEEDFNVTMVPPVGAPPERVTVPVELVPPTTELGETDTLAKLPEVRVSVPVRLKPLRVPVTVTVVVASTLEVVTAKVAVDAPPGIVTVPGNVTEGELELSEITIPAVGAVPAKVTLPVVGLPATTVEGVKLTE